MISWGILFAVVIVFTIIEGEDVLKTAFGSFFLGGVPLFFGILLLRRIRKKSKTTNELMLQQNILKLAKLNEGKVTESDAAMALNISLDDSRILLQKFTSKGYAEPSIDERGYVFYTFKEFTN